MIIFEFEVFLEEPLFLFLQLVLCVLCETMSNFDLFRELQMVGVAHLLVSIIFCNS